LSLDTTKRRLMASALKMSSKLSRQGTAHEVKVRDDLPLFLPLIRQPFLLPPMSHLDDRRQTLKTSLPSSQSHWHPSSTK
jgi:hypothetical protein